MLCKWLKWSQGGEKVARDGEGEREEGRKRV